MIVTQDKTTTLYSYQNGIGANTEAILTRTLGHILYGDEYVEEGGDGGLLWNSTSVVMLHISDAANAYHTFEGSPTRSNMGASLTGGIKWAGGVLAPNGKIYCVPRNAEDILIIDPATNTATISTMGASLTGSDKWLGGVLAPNGKIYCVPINAADILIIDKNPSVPALDIKDCLSPHLNKF